MWGSSLSLSLPLMLLHFRFNFFSFLFDVDVLDSLHFGGILNYLMNQSFQHSYVSFFRL